MQIFLTALFLLSQAPAFSAELLIEKTLRVGETLELPAHGHVTLPQNKVLQIRDLGSKYQILALKQGTLDFRIGPSSYRISILRNDQLQTFQKLQTVVRKSLGLGIEIKLGQVIVTGKMLSWKNWRDLATQCQEISCEYVAQFSVPESLRLSLQKEFSDYLEGLGYSSFRIQWGPQISVMIPEKSLENGRLEFLLRQFGVVAVREHGTLELAPSTRVQMMILEMNRDQSMSYGIKWPQEYSAQLLPKADSIDPLMVSAQALESSGVGRVLASPNILCRSGKDCEFLAGGEIPFKIVTAKMTDVIWKKFGILLKIKPVADFSGRMSIGIEAEISKIDTSTMVDGLPGFLTNRVQSHFDLIEPRTIALSGLLRMEQGEAKDGLALLSRIPILGSLFSSTNFKQRRSELVILVRPELEKAEEEGAR